MRVRDSFEYAVVLVLARIASAMPIKVSLDFGARLGDLTFSLLRVRRKVTFANLRFAFGTEKSPEDIELIARKTYRNFGRMLMEFARFPKLTKKDIAELITFSNPDLLERALGQGKGVIFLSGHFGNWEMMAGAIAMRIGAPLNVLVARQRNRLVDSLMNSFRLSLNVNPIPVGISVKSILRILKDGGVVGILADQDSRKRGVFVDFMGHPASTPKGPAAIALRMKVPVLMVFAVRDGPRHRIFIEDLDIPDNIEDDEDGIRLFTQVYTEVLERYVRRYPDHWFWMHRRWKTKPQPVDAPSGPKHEI